MSSRGFSILDVVAAKVRVGEADYPRPCIVIDIGPGDCLRLLPCSTKFEGYYRPGVDFPIREDDPTFAETGLEDSSFVIDGSIYVTETSEVRGPFGRLTGELAERFEKWVGPSG